MSLIGLILLILILVLLFERRGTWRGGEPLSMLLSVVLVVLLVLLIVSLFAYPRFYP